MQATPGAMPQAEQSPYLQSQSNRVPEYLYQAATLVAVLLLLWTAAV